MTRATFGIWGKTLAVRIPAEIFELTGFAPGERIEVSGQRGEIVIRRAPASALAEMFAGKSPEEWRALYAGTDPWGPDVGREVVEP